MLGTPRSFFGVHSFTPYSRLDGTFYGTIKVLASSSLSFQGTLVQLNGGSAKYPWAVEEGKISSQLNLKTNEYPDFLFQLFGGAVPTENGANSLGAISTLKNVKGTSILASTGVASVGIISGSESDLKFGKYIIKALTSTTFQVYCDSDVDFGSGTSKTFYSSALDLSATSYTLTQSTATNIVGWGFKVTGDSGTIGLVAGDTASFEILPINTANMVMTMGNVEASFPEFGAIVMAKKRGSGELMEVDLPRVKGEGIPLGFDEDKWSQCDVKCMVMFDPVLNYVARMRSCSRTTPN